MCFRDVRISVNKEQETFWSASVCNCCGNAVSRLLVLESEWIGGIMQLVRVLGKSRSQWVLESVCKAVDVMLHRGGYLCC
jgi:hypothetical protein